MTKRNTSSSGNMPVSVELGSGGSTKSDSYYLRQYSRMNSVKGKLGESDRMELLGLIINAGKLMKTCGTFDAESMADAASLSLKDALKKQGVDLKDALKGMFLIFTDAGSQRASTDYSSLV